jgi:predicted ATPase
VSRSNPTVFQKPLPLEAIELEGFKSFKHLKRFNLSPGLNVLIGANGSGKTNFIKFFELLGNMMDKPPGLQNYVASNGWADAFLFRGVETTEQFRARLWFALNEYRFALKAATGGSLFFSEEAAPFDGPIYGPVTNDQGSGHKESSLTGKIGTAAEQFVLQTIGDWRVYHFHNTSARSPMMLPVNSIDCDRLRSDAGNIAAFLLKMRETQKEYYDRIVSHIRLAAPYFGDFELKEVSQGQTQLLWKERYSPKVFYPSQLSDGSLRFICLAALLLQPKPPSTIVIDEPELGLHPYAITVVAGMLGMAASKCQLIVSTQSSPLVDHLQLKDIIIVDRKDGETTLTRPDPTALKDWLADYSLGTLWDKNVLGGRPQP